MPRRSFEQRYECSASSPSLLPFSVFPITGKRRTPRAANVSGPPLNGRMHPHSTHPLDEAVTWLEHLERRRRARGTTAEAIRGRVQLIVTSADRGGGGDGGAGTAAGSESGEDTLAFESCELDAYGPIPPAVADRVAARTAQWDRVMIDTNTGEALRVHRYRPSERMRRMPSVRDRTCRFPGCRMPAHRCDLDHNVDAAKGGSTSTDNLAFLCRGHHMLKHHSGWSVNQRAGGIPHWISPTGRRYVDRPPGARSRRRPPSESGSGDSPVGKTTAGSTPDAETGAEPEPSRPLRPRQRSSARARPARRDSPTRRSP